MQFLSYLINGISLGSVYALIALGYTMVYGIAKMLNFAHGDVIMIGSYVVFFAFGSAGMNPVLAIVLSMVVCTVLGVTIERVAYRPLREAPSLAVLITAIGVSYLLQQVAQLAWTSNPKSFTYVVSGLKPISLFGVLVGIPVLRLSGDYLAIVTLAFGEIVKNVMNACYLGVDSHGLHFSLKDSASLNLETDGKVLINGAMGITGIKKASTFTIGIVLVIITLLVILNLVNSRAGRAIKAIRDNEIAARSVGIPITKYKLMAFVTSAVFAGVAGVLYALNYSSLVAKKFDYNTSILILVFVVLGGIGNLRGSVIAAAVLTVLPELLRSMNDYRMLIYAIVLIVVMIFNQSPAMIALRKRLTARFRKEDAEGKGAKDKEKKGVA